MKSSKTYDQLLAENEQLRIQLDEATETIQAIRSGQVDALVVQSGEGDHELYTLKTSDQTYRLFIETMHEGAVTLNEQGLILYGNSMFASIVDQPLPNIVGAAFTRFIDESDRDAYQTFFKRSWHTSEKAELAICQGNQTITCLLSATSLALDEGNCLSIIITDLTAQKDTQELLRVSNEQLTQLNTALKISNYALNRSNDNLQQFAYVASHDLQEPLRKIQQFGNLLTMQYGPILGEQGADLLQRMASAAVRMSTLIRDLLTYSRLSVPANGFPVQNLEVLINDVVGLLDLTIQEADARITTEPLGQIHGDATQLGQLFQNLLTNALKFRRKDVPPHIHIRQQAVGRTDLPPAYQPLGEQEQFCHIQVIDNGIGFEPHQVDRIFGAFQRLHGKGAYPGTGIGLAIVKKVVENHQGYVTAESQPGQGATFHVYLPL